MIVIFLVLRYFKETRFVRYLLTFRLIQVYYKFAENSIEANRQLNEKENVLFSKSKIGYWVTKSPISVICRFISIGGIFIFSILSKICVTIDLYSEQMLIC